MNSQASVPQNPTFSHVSSTEQIYLEKYLNTLNEKEMKAYHIASEHLGMSFQLEKSIGYLNWKKENVPT
jgi:predicted phage-related endonuclease